LGFLWALLLLIASWLYVPPEPPPPPTLEERICSYDWECEVAIAVFTCESQLGRDPDAYNLDEPNGGIAQLNRQTWEWWFLYYYGWEWQAIVTNDDLNLAAAYIVWQEHKRVFNETGWFAWSCYD